MVSAKEASAAHSDWSEGDHTSKVHFLQALQIVIAQLFPDDSPRCVVLEGCLVYSMKYEVTLPCYGRYQIDFCLEDTVRCGVSHVWNKTCIDGTTKAAAA